MPDRLPGSGTGQLLGSVHKYSNGYGYGARVPTSRNIPTQPSSVPQYRYPPVSERTLAQFRPPVSTLRTSQADERHAHQILYQTSGDWGKHYVISKDLQKQRTLRETERETNRITKLNQIPTSPIVTSNRNYEPFSNNNNNNNNSIDLHNSKRDNIQQNDSNYKYDISAREEKRLSALGFNNSSNQNYSGRNLSNNSNNNNGNVYSKTLKNLDVTFPTNCKYDLIAATVPSKPAQERSWVAVTNHMNKQNALGFSYSLRSGK
jgi:hypothetical protein